MNPLCYAPVAAALALSSTSSLAAAAPTTTVQQPLTASESTLWTQKDISVCWENGSGSTFVQQVRTMKAIKNTWQKHSRINFFGWGNCKANSKGVRIQIADAGPHTKGLGRQLDGVKNGMVLNFTFNNWGSACLAGGKSTLDGCVESIAVHEFGHALGFSHEHNRHDSLCSQPHQGTDGGFWISPYDKDSVMNYCAASSPTLTALDIAGVQQVYGARGSSGPSTDPKMARWYVSFSGKPTWTRLNTADETALQTGDFNGDGVDDVFTAKNGRWYASYGGTSKWTQLNKANETYLKLGDFNGDGKTDVFTKKNGYWHVSYGGTTKWKKINKAGEKYLRFGDFNGDGKTDVMSLDGGKWKVSYSGTAKWKVINSASDPGVKLGDFNGDGKADAFVAKSGGWYVSYGGTTKWTRINRSKFTDVRLADLNGDGTTDVVRLSGRNIHVSYGGKRRWRTSFANAAIAGKTWLFGDFDGNGSDDVLVRWK